MLAAPGFHAVGRSLFHFYFCFRWHTLCPLVLLEKHFASLQPEREWLYGRTCEQVSSNLFAAPNLLLQTDNSFLNPRASAATSIIAASAIVAFSPTLTSARITCSLYPTGFLFRNNHHFSTSQIPKNCKQFSSFLFHFLFCPFLVFSFLLFDNCQTAPPKYRNRARASRFGQSGSFHSARFFLPFFFHFLTQLWRWRFSKFRHCHPLFFSLIFFFNYKSRCVFFAGKIVFKFEWMFCWRFDSEKFDCLFTLNFGCSQN